MYICYYFVINITLTAQGSTLDVRIWRLQTSVLKSKVDPRILRVKLYLMALDIKHRYEKETDRAN